MIEKANMDKSIKGKIHSFQSFGSVDGPGIRFVVFMQGCNLRCKCCHNPDTFDRKGGKEFSAEQVFDKIIRCKEYFGKDGGLTISGGEPLLQAKFCKELFSICKQNGINTCLDTSGSIMNEEIQELLSLTDRVLLDIKYTNDNDYLQNVGCSIFPVLEFLDYTDKKGIKTTIRQVIIPSKNDNAENILLLNEIIKKHSSIDTAELLPFRKICQAKYDNLNIDFPFKDILEPTKEKMQELNNLLKI